MALFGIDTAPPAGAARALAAAKGMAEALRDLNRLLESDLPAPLRIGIGLHAGPAIVGEMGYAPAVSVTAVGDTVNTASRLESMSKEFAAQLVVSADEAKGRAFTTGIAPDASSWIGRSNPFAATGVLQYPIGRVTTPQLAGYRDLLPPGRLGPYLVRALPLPDSCEPLLAHSVNDLSVVVARHPYRSR